MARPSATAPCLFIGVNEYEVELLQVRRRCMDGGRLWLFVAKHNSALGFAWFAFRSAFLGLSEADDFERLKATEVEVRLSASAAPVAADGEVERMRGPLRYRIRPRDLRVPAAPIWFRPERPVPGPRLLPIRISTVCSGTPPDRPPLLLRSCNDQRQLRRLRHAWCAAGWSESRSR
ncbi:MAG: hypothetical protein U1E17_09135 [Geminicoccaceae bacterium]